MGLHLSWPLAFPQAKTEDNPSTKAAFATDCWQEHRLAKLTQFGTSQIFAVFSLNKSHKRSSRCMLQFKLWMTSSFLYVFLCCPETEISPNDMTAKLSI